MRSLFLSIHMLILFALIGLAATPQPVAAQTEGVQPAQGAPGTTFSFFAYGFEPQVTVVYWAHDPNGETYGNPYYRTFTNGEGRADWQWAAPGDALSGTWTMVARQLNNETRAQTIPFEVLPLSDPAADPVPPAAPNNPDPAAQNVEPAAGPAGAQFNFFATGFKPDETVGYWFNSPDGTIVSDEARYKARANDQGRADWSWISPVSATPGLWQAVAKGQDSGIERAIFFEIRPFDTSRTDIGVEPRVGGPRTTFAFFALGFNPGETVTYWAIAPDGEQTEREHYQVDANEEGRADWFWRPPVADEADPGLWQMVAYGQDSALTEVIPFEIRFE